MTIRVRVFGGMRAFFAEDLDVELAEGVAVCDVARELGNMRPACAALLANCVYALDSGFVDPECVLREGAVLEVMPPFSGG